MPAPKTDPGAAMTPTLALEKPEALAALHPRPIPEEKNLTSLFQPVLSVKKMRVVGLEPVGRALDPSHRRFLEPRDFFRDRDCGDSTFKLALERFFHQKGLELFSGLQSQMYDPLLFLNIDPSTLDEKVVGSGYLLRQVAELSLAPRQIVLQISLGRDWNRPLVGKFIRLQRQDGFIIALKDVDAGRGRLDAVFRIHPDILKVTDRLTRGLARITERQDDFRGVVKQAHSLGVSVMAGALEGEEDALKALEYGADLLQGGYFTRNYGDNAVLTLGRKARMMFLASRYHRRMARRIQMDRDLKGRCQAAGDSLFHLFRDKPAELLEKGLSSQFPLYPALECLYLLDDKGVQASETPCNEANIPERKRFLYRPAPRGTDHALREYYYALSTGLGRHVTDPYLSLNSGNLCVTYARIMENPMGGGDYILCSDWNCSKI